MYICKECQREVPDKSYITPNGCIWCDYRYYISEQEEKRISAVIKILKNEI